MPHKRMVNGTYIADFRHVIPKRLLIADETLKIKDKNQKKLTALSRFVPVWAKENWSVVAVMAEKNVATVVMLRYFNVAFSSAPRIGGNTFPIRTQKNMSNEHIESVMRTFFWNDSQHFCCIIDTPGDVRQNIVKELLTNDIIGT